MPEQRFQDRRDAGRRLAQKLERYADDPEVLVLGLPRGGVPVAWEVADALNAPMDALIVRKLGVPGHPELAMGAIATGGLRVLNQGVLDSYSIAEEAVARVAAEEQNELERRDEAYRGGRPPPEITGRTVLLIDDGLATGATMRAAVMAVRAQDPKRIVVGVPVGAESSCRELEEEADEVVCVVVPVPFFAVGAWYESFDPVGDAEVHDLLSRADREAEEAA